MDTDFAELTNADARPVARRRPRFSNNAQASEGYDVYPVQSQSLKRADIEAQARMASIQKIIMDLDAAYFEDYGKALDPASRAGFEGFMHVNQKIRRPMLSADSSGSLVATWQAGRECLSLRFLDRFECHYALVVEIQGGNLERTWGQDRATLFLAADGSAMRIARQ